MVVFVNLLNKVEKADIKCEILFLCSPLSIPSVVVTISTLANPQQSGGMHLLVARSVLSLPVVQADCVEQRLSRRRRTRSDFLDNKNVFQKNLFPFPLWLSNTHTHINYC